MSMTTTTPPHSGFTTPSKITSSTVTSVIIHDVKVSHHDDYDKHLEQFKRILIQQLGFQSQNVLRPVGEELRYVIILRFDNIHSAELWFSSEIRHHMLKKIETWLVNGDNYQTHVDPDFWFKPTLQTNKPKRWKQFLLAWVGVLPWAITIPLLLLYLAQRSPPIPRIFISLIISLVISWLMTYISMPFVTKKMAWWLIK